MSADGGSQQQQQQQSAQPGSQQQLQQQQQPSSQPGSQQQQQQQPNNPASIPQQACQVGLVCWQGKGWLSAHAHCVFSSLVSCICALRGCPAAHPHMLLLAYAL
jgi:hypothetical protein